MGVIAFIADGTAETDEQKHGEVGGIGQQQAKQ